jgi:hypothetical protein
VAVVVPPPDTYWATLLPLSVVDTVLPPDSTVCEYGLNTVSRLATIPEETSSKISSPPLESVRPVRVPPEMTSVAPLITVTPLVLPPADTISNPPLEIVVVLATPPEETIDSPPLEIIVPLATPPEDTSCSPVLDTVVPIATPVKTV